MMAVEFEPGPVLPVSITSGIIQRGGVAIAQLHVLGSVSMMCFVAPDQSADASQEPVLPVAFLSQAQFSSGPQPQYLFLRA